MQCLKMVKKKNQCLVILKQLDSTALRLLVNFIYSGEITVAENNLQFQEVIEACCDFLLAKMSPKNCIAINVLTDLHSCTKLLTSSELYIHQHFSDVVEGAEFLSLSYEQMVKLISCDELKIPSEEKVFEFVIRWVKYDLRSRKCILPQLMEHVRLPLTSKDNILKKIIEEPLVSNCLKSKDYVIEALHFHLLKSDELVTIPHHIRTKPRQPGGSQKVEGVDGLSKRRLNSVECYHPRLDKWTPVTKISVRHSALGISVVNGVVYAVGGTDGFEVHKSVEAYSLSTGIWISIPDMHLCRKFRGVAVLDGLLYVVGGDDGISTFDSVEFYNPKTKTWTMVKTSWNDARTAAVTVATDRPQHFRSR